MENKRFIVFTGQWSEDINEKTIPSLGEGDFISCADGGYLVCLSMGFTPDIVIGDFDSLTPEQIAGIDELGIERIVHPCEKDETDTLLCVKYGISKGFEKFVLIGGIGGDFGHTMANLQVLSFLTDFGCEAEIITEKERLLMADGESISAVRETRPAAPLLFYGKPGSKFSVLSYAERCSGVYIKNAKYELNDAVLTQSYPVGAGNEFIGEDPVEVGVRYGRLLVVINRDINK